MPNSYRIRTEVGVNQNLQVKLEQEYDMLELLSLQIFQSDIYTRDCANYGVVCGRVFCNKGLGLPNAKISVFIPLQPEDENDPLITTLYPYTDIYTVNDDGYKYNLLPYTQSYSNHVPVGTFPDRLDNLNDESVIKVYDKYYKHVVRTNDSGDFMIIGAPLGQQTIFMQIDLSDMGEFSLTPQDLIRMGVATESQVDGTKFKFSENYSELPQIVTLAKTVQVSPFFGQKEVCNYNIARVDFDLTSEASIRLEPTAVFMGSLISSDTKRKVKKNCKVKSKLGFNCELVSGPGQIDAIRQTIFNDSEGKPVLEVANLENKGKVIDENGAWLTEVPMNMNYVYTNENGDKVISNDPKIGVPTVGKYRFKVKWNQSNKLSEENRRAYFLVPNIREYGWNVNEQDTDPVLLPNTETDFSLTNNLLFDLTNNSNSDYGVKLIKFQNLDSYKIFIDGVERPDYNDGIPLFKFATGTAVQIQFTKADNSLPLEFSLEEIPKQKFLLEQSYAFSLSWDDYANPTAAIDCEDTFYEMHFNKVYTVSQFIDRFSSSIYTFNTLQIKNIQDDSCEGLVNKFPMNDTYYRIVFLYILLSALIMPIFQYLLIVLTLVLHILGFIIGIINCVIIRFINVIIRIINKFFIKIINKIVQIVRKIQCKICEIVQAIQERSWLPFNISTPDFCSDGAKYVRPIRCIKYIKNPFLNKGLPLILYTDDGCERCKCWSKADWQDNVNEADQSGGVSNTEEGDDSTASIQIDCAECSDAPCAPCSINFQLQCESVNANIPNPDYLGRQNCEASCSSGNYSTSFGFCGGTSFFPGEPNTHIQITTVAYGNYTAGEVLTPTDQQCRATINTTVANEASPCSDCGNGSIDCELCDWDLVYPPLVVAPIAGNNSSSSEYGNNNAQVTENTPGPYDTVIQSASNCSLAVNCAPQFSEIVSDPQNADGCYQLDIDPNSSSYGAPYISFDQETGYPYCVFLDLEPIKILQCPTAQPGTSFKFQYQAGCFNLISKPIVSFPDDLLSIFEWSERVLINMAICLDVFSHSFSNSWINGTMYAFPFQNSTTFDNENDPQREYCNEIIYLHSGSNNFYYRSSPVALSNVENVTDPNFIFIGKNPIKNNGFLGNNIKVANVRYMLTPTTILDLGPKVSYLQELALNDDLDGYIVNTLKPTSTAEITDIINMYVLSRLLNQSWIKLLVRLLSPASLGFSVGNFFRNKRWGNGSNLDLADFFPTVGDGDYSQMLNQHTQYGLQPFDNNTYNGLDIFFGTDNLFNPLAADLRGQPFFGIYFSGNTQDRDYITPRRTNWLTQATIPGLSTITEVTYLPTKSQIVPMYQWLNPQGQSGPPDGDSVESPIDTIFGNQDNDYETSNNSYSSGSYFKQYYQKLDRADEASISKYMNNGNTNLELRKGWLVNITQTDSTDPERPDTQEDLITIGSPYHFYFGSIPGATALDLFFIKYVDNEEILL